MTKEEIEFHKQTTKDLNEVQNILDDLFRDVLKEMTWESYQKAYKMFEILTNNNRELQKYYEDRLCKR